MTPMFNYQLPPVDLPTLPNYWKLQRIDKILQKALHTYQKQPNSTDSSHPSTNQYKHNSSRQRQMQTPQHTNDQVNKIIDQTCAPKTSKSEPEDKYPHDSQSPDNNIDSSSDPE